MTAYSLDRTSPVYALLGGARTYYQDAILDATQNRDEAVQRARIGALLTEAHRLDELDPLLIAADYLNRLDVVTLAAHVHAPDTLRRVKVWTKMRDKLDPHPEGEQPLPEMTQCRGTEAMQALSPKAPRELVTSSESSAFGLVKGDRHPYLAYSIQGDPDARPRKRMLQTGRMGLLLFALVALLYAFLCGRHGG